MSRFTDRAKAVEHAIELLTRGYNSVFIRNDDEDNEFDVYSCASELAPDYIGWTYAEGLDIPEAATDHTRLMESCESLDTLAQFRYNMPALAEWLDEDSTADISLEWTPVEDENLEYDDESGGYLDEDGELLADNLAGHVYLMKIWE